MQQLVPIRTDLAQAVDPDAVVNAWGAHLATEYAPPTRAAYLKALRLFRAHLAVAGVPFTSATPREVVAWREGLKGAYSPQTVNLWLTGARRFFAWLVEQGVPIVNPAAGVRGATRRGQGQRHKRDELTSREVIGVLQTCAPSLEGARDRAILALMCYCGLRTVEIHRADLTNLQTRDDRLVLWVHGKGHAEADDFVVVPAAAEDALRGWLSQRGEAAGALFTSLSNRSRGGRLSLRAIRAMVKDRYRQAGVAGQGKTTHSLRHSAISAAIRGGATPLQAQAMARHRSFDTTLAYYHAVGRTAQPAEDLISYGAQAVEL